MIIPGKVRLALCLATVLLCWHKGIVPAEANDVTLERSFSLSTSNQVVSAYAIIIGETPFDSTKSPESTRQAKVTRVSPDNYEIVVQLQPADLQENKRISVVAETDSAKLITLEVAPTMPPQDQAIISTRCLIDRKKEFDKLALLNKESLDALVEIRNTKVQVLEKKLSNLLTPSIITKLNKAEREFGLEHAQPISANTPVDELAIRVKALSAVIKNR